MKSYKNSESRKDFFHKPKKEPKVERHPSEIPHLHDAFTKARGHFNIDHLETDGGYKHGKFKNTRTFGQRTQTIDTDHALATQTNKTNQYFSQHRNRAL